MVPDRCLGVFAVLIFIFAMLNGRRCERYEIASQQQSFSLCWIVSITIFNLRNVSVYFIYLFVLPFCFDFLSTDWHWLTALFSDFITMPGPVFLQIYRVLEKYSYRLFAHTYAPAIIKLLQCYTGKWCEFCRQPRDDAHVHWIFFFDASASAWM